MAKITVHHNRYSQIRALLSPMSGWLFRGLYFDGKTSTMFKDHGITVIATHHLPRFSFIKFHDSAPKFESTSFFFNHQRLGYELPVFPLDTFTVSATDLPEDSSKDSLFLFPNAYSIADISLYQINVKGHDYWIEVEHFDERGERHEIELDISVDVGLCIALENGKSILLTIGDDMAIYSACVGTKAAFKAQGLLRSPWLRDDNYVDWEELRIV